MKVPELPAYGLTPRAYPCPLDAYIESKIGTGSICKISGIRPIERKWNG
jgi:hypothetical protein